jgi:DNA primase small subunit
MINTISPIIVSPNELKNYYNYKFPFDLIYKMIIMNNDNYSGEISPSDRDLAIFYIDNNCFKKFDRDDKVTLKNKFNSFNIMNIHFGSMLIKNEKHNLKMQHLYKELVFDIDITDYIRFCECKDMKKICQVCWLHMEGSYLILNHFLLEICGYRKENLLWVFSGMKGIHCLVNDQKAIKLSNNERMNLFHFINIEKDDDKKLINTIKFYQKQYPKFIEQLEYHFFQNVIYKRNLFSYKAFDSFFLSIMSTQYSPIYSHLINFWKKRSSSYNNNNNEEGSSMTIDDTDENESITKWKLLIKYERLFSFDNDKEESITNKNQVKPSLFIIFKLYYMQIDEGPVSLTHLIKLPFTIHSGTKNISMPIDGDKILSFNIENDSVHLSTIKKNSNSNKIFNESISILEKWINNYPNLCNNY